MRRVRRFGRQKLIDLVQSLNALIRLAPRLCHSYRQHDSRGRTNARPDPRALSVVKPWLTANARWALNKHRLLWARMSDVCTNSSSTDRRLVAPVHQFGGYRVKPSRRVGWPAATACWISSMQGLTPRDTSAEPANRWAPAPSRQLKRSAGAGGYDSERRNIEPRGSTSPTRFRFYVVQRWRPCRAINKSR